MNHSASRLRLSRVLCWFVAALGGALAIANASAHGVTLKVHHFHSADSPFHTQFLVPWARKVEKDSGGRLHLQLFPAMQLGGTPAQLYDQVREGKADIVWTAAGYTPGRFPAFQVFELPFLGRTARGASRALWEYVDANDLAGKEFDEVRLLAVHVHGVSQFHMVTRPVASLADLTGAKLRSPTRAATALLRAAGAQPSEMPIVQVPEALAKGALDGVVTSWVALPAIKLDTMVKFHTTVDAGSPWPFAIAFVLAMNPDAFRALPDDLKDVVRANSGADTSALIGQVYDEAGAAARQSAAGRGAPIAVLSAGELTKWKQPAQVVIDAWIADLDQRGLNGKRLLDGARNALELFDPAQ